MHNLSHHGFCVAGLCLVSIFLLNRQLSLQGGHLALQLLSVLADLGSLGLQVTQLKSGSQHTSTNNS